MAWPFSNVVAPNLDTGPGQSVPLAATAITASACWVMGVYFKNVSTNTRIVTLTDTAGNLVHKVTLPAGSNDPQERPFEPCTGLKWSVDGGVLGDVLGHVWGYV